MRGWPVHRPTHAPATTLKTNGNSAPPQNKKSKPLVPSSPEHVKQSPHPPNPSCSRSCGGMRGWPVHRPTHAPATTLKTNGNSAPPQNKKSKPLVPSSPEAARSPETNPQPPNPSCCRSRGGMRGWPVHRPTHAPATTLKTNGNSAPPQNKKSKPLVPSSPEAARRRMTTPVVNTPPDTGAIPQRKKKQHRHSGIFISRKRNENIRNLRRKAGMTPHWRECEAPLRRTQRNGADETILCRSQAPLRIPAPAIAPGTNTAPAAKRACLPSAVPENSFTPSLPARQSTRHAIFSRRLLPRALRPAEKRIQRQPIKPQITTPQMLKQTPARKRQNTIRLLRVHYAECVILVHPGAHIRTLVHIPPEYPAQRLVRQSPKIPRQRNAIIPHTPMRRKRRRNRLRTRPAQQAVIPAAGGRPRRRTALNQRQIVLLAVRQRRESQRNVQTVVVDLRHARAAVNGRPALRPSFRLRQPAVKTGETRPAFLKTHRHNPVADRRA